MHRLRGFRCLLVDHLLEQGGEQQDDRDSVFCTTVSGDRVAYEWNFNTPQLFIYRMRLSGMGSDAALLYWNHGGESSLVRKPNHIKIYILSNILFRNNNQHPTHIGFLTRYPLIRLWNRTGSLERCWSRLRVSLRWWACTMCIFAGAWLYSTLAILSGCLRKSTPKTTP